MKRTLNLLMRTLLPAIGLLALLGAVIAAMCALFPSGSDLGDFFRRILEIFPIITVFFLAILGSSLYITGFQTVLSFGGTRRHFFLSFQLMALLASLLFLGMYAALDAVAGQLLKEGRMVISLNVSPTLWLFILSMFFLGPLWTLAINRSKLWGTVFTIISTSIVSSVVFIEIIPTGGVWWDLSLMLTLCLIAAAVIMDLCLWYSSRRMIVR